MSAAMSQAIGSVDHIPSQADYVNLRDDLAFREVIILKYNYYWKNIFIYWLFLNHKNNTYVLYKGRAR